MPQTIDNKKWALAPEGCFSVIWTSTTGLRENAILRAVLSGFGNCRTVVGAKAEIFGLPKDVFDRDSTQIYNSRCLMQTNEPRQTKSSPAIKATGANGTQNRQPVSVHAGPGMRKFNPRGPDCGRNRGARRRLNVA